MDGRLSYQVSMVSNGIWINCSALHALGDNGHSTTSVRLIVVLHAEFYFAVMA